MLDVGLRNQHAVCRLCSGTRVSHHDFDVGGFTIEHLEEQEVTVMEAETGAELIAWTRAFGLARLLNGVTRIVVALSTE